MRNILATAGLSAGLLAFAACGSGGEETTPAGGADSGGAAEDAREAAMEAEIEKYGFEGDVELGEDGEPDKIEITRGGNTVGKNLDLPDGFPDDIPFPAEWSIIHTTPIPGGFMVQATTDDSVDTVLGKLRSGMTGAGWTETTSDAPSPQMTRIGFEKGGQMANFNLIHGGGQVSVQLATMPKP